MSEPVNELDQTESYITHGVIAAFKTTTDAESTPIKLSSEYNMGDAIGNGIILVNDHRPSPTQLMQFNIQYDWVSLQNITTLTAGEIVIADRNATGFLKFLKEEVVATLGTSLENITFVMKLFWITNTGKGAANNPEVIDSEKFYFSTTDIRHSSSGNKNFYMMPVLALYNSKPQLPTYCNLYNLTITHAAGNLHNEMPTPQSPGGGIRPRAEEDEKLEPRSTRIAKSKPMKTLGDAFKALEIELNENSKIHKGQLQQWQAHIRDDFVDKLKNPPEQEKDIPIKFKITLDPTYEDYKIDNRNLPFEQPEQEQKEPGIRTIPVKTGEDLFSVTSKIFSMSKQIGIDSRHENNQQRPKMVAVWRRQGDEVLIDIRIMRHDIPYNEPGEDSGPGESNVNPITFFYRSTGSDNSNVDVYKLTGETSRIDLLHVVEESPEEENGQVSFGADREQITVERMKDLPFFESGYSGNRSFLAVHKVMGVEYPNELAEYLKFGYSMQYSQDAEMAITIRGNPRLFSDLMRKPTDVANGNAGKPAHYKFPEIYPLYAKFRVFYTEDDSSGFEVENVKGEFYHKDTYMHIRKVENHLTNGIFTQKLHLLRSDEVV